jgi:uncharacterized membrane protein/predicted DsbA family dithiol-disulfide isomerase
MSRTARRLVLVFALLGFGASIASSYVHYQLLKDSTYASVCDINAMLSCTEVYSSPYSMMFGVPVAILGVLWFVLILLLVATTGRAKQKVQENLAGYVFALSTLALAAVLYLAYSSFFVLRLACIFCTLTYVAVIGIFIVSGAATAFPMTTLPGRAMRDLRALLAAPAALTPALLFLGGAAAVLAFFPREHAGPALPISTEAPPADTSSTADPRSEFERWYDSLPRVDLPIPREGAAVLIVKFNDYQCPPCRMTFFDYKKVLAKYADRSVRFVTRDFPLDSECNATVKGTFHESGCEAAVAVRLARRRGKAEELENWLFTNQSTLTPDVVRAAARDVAGVTDFDAEYAKTVEDVKKDIALGMSLKVNSTPTFFINNVALPPGGMPAEYFDAAIAYELRKAGK